MLLQLFSQNKQLRGTVSHLADTLGRLLEFRWNVRWEGDTRLKTWSSASSKCRYGIHSSAVGRVFVEAVVIMNPRHQGYDFYRWHGWWITWARCVCMCVSLYFLCLHLVSMATAVTQACERKRMCSKEIKGRIAALIVNWNQKTAAG